MLNFKVHSTQEEGAVGHAQAHLAVQSVRKAQHIFFSFDTASVALAVEFFPIDRRQDLEAHPVHDLFDHLAQLRALLVFATIIFLIYFLLLHMHVFGLHRSIQRRRLLVIDRGFQGDYELTELLRGTQRLLLAHFENTGA